MRKGMIPALLGIAVTGTAIAMSDPDVFERGMKKKNVDTMMASGLIGFGLAHIVLGGMDLFKER